MTRAPSRRSALKSAVEECLGASVSPGTLDGACAALAVDPDALVWMTDAATISRGCGTRRLIDSTALSQPKVIEPILSGQVGLAEAAVPLIATACELKGQTVVVTTCVLRNLRAYLHPNICTQNTVGAARDRYDSAAKLTEDVMSHALKTVGLARHRVMFLGMGRFDFIARAADAKQAAMAASDMMTTFGSDVAIMQSDHTATDGNVADILAQDTLSNQFRVNKAADRTGFNSQRSGELPHGRAIWLSVPPIGPLDASRDMSCDLSRGRLDVSGCSRLLREGNAGVVQMQSRGVLLNAFFCQLIPEICTQSASYDGPVVPLFSSTDDLIVVGPNDAVTRCLEQVCAQAQSILGAQTTFATTSVEPKRPANTARRLANLMC
ncbi:MAG: hypothetical protein V7775_14845 [Sulfitobacter sp.]